MLKYPFGRDPDISDVVLTPQPLSAAGEGYGKTRREFGGYVRYMDMYSTVVVLRYISRQYLACILKLGDTSEKVPPCDPYSHFCTPSLKPKLHGTEHLSFTSLSLLLFFFSFSTYPSVSSTMKTFPAAIKFGANQIRAQTGAPMRSTKDRRGSLAGVEGPLGVAGLLSAPPTRKASSFHL